MIFVGGILSGLPAKYENPIKFDKIPLHHLTLHSPPSLISLSSSLYLYRTHRWHQPQSTTMKKAARAAPPLPLPLAPLPFLSLLDPVEGRSHAAPSARVGALPYLVGLNNSTDDVFYGNLSFYSLMYFFTLKRTLNKDEMN